MDSKKLITTLIVFIVVLIVLAVVIVSTLNFGNDDKKSTESSIDDVTTSFVHESVELSDVEAGVVGESSEVIISAEESSVEVLSPELVLPPDVSLTSQNIVVYSAKYDSVVFEKNRDTKTSPASITKLVTALVVLEHLETDKVLRVGTEIELVGKNSSTAWLYKDQYLTVEQLIDAMLIPSGNDAAYTLAVNTADYLDNSGSRMDDEAAVAAFVKLMNDKANELGCRNTVFCTPDGYDAEGQYTTAEDLLLISRAAYQNDVIKKSVSKVSSGSWTNSNLLINSESRYYSEYVTGLKTGSTVDAGYCVTVSVELEDDTLFLVLLCSPTRDGRFLDALNIIDAIKTNGMVMRPQ